MTKLAKIRPPVRTSALALLAALALAACGTTPEPASAGVRLDAARNALTARPGEALEVALTAAAAGGTEVQLRADALPDGVVASFTPNPAREGSRLRLEVAADAQFGTHAVTIAGTADGVEGFLELALTIAEASDADGEPRAAPSEAPATPARFRFYVPSRQKVETRISMLWARTEGAEGYRVYRRIVPVAQPTFDGANLKAQGVAPYPTVPSPYGWQEVADRAHEDNHWTDEDLPPLETRALGAPYCYRVEAYNAAGASEPSEEVCTRMRGLNAPYAPTLGGETRTSIDVSWVDTSALEDGFRVYRTFPGSDTRVATVAAGREATTVTGLEPGRTYCFTVTAFDYYGETERRGGTCTETLPEPDDPGPEEKTYTLNLQRQQIYEGNVPYYARLPTGSGSGDGNVTGVDSPDWVPTLYFVKPGHDTGECADPDAVVVLEPGTELTASEMDEAFGSKTPSLPVHFLACAGTETQLLDWIPINVTYTGHL